jgi:hypothetical protein
MKTLCELLSKLSASTLSILQNQKTLSFNDVKKLIILSMKNLSINLFYLLVKCYNL